MKKILNANKKKHNAFASFKIKALFNQKGFYEIEKH